MFQKLTLVGNLGRDPDMRYLPDGTAVTNFSLAVNRRWTDRQSSEPVEETTWFRVSVWGRPAETANQYLSKGRQVLVEGTLVPDPATGSPRLWTRSDGTIGSSFEVRASTVRFLGGGNGNGSGAAAEVAAVDEDDLPF